MVECLDGTILLQIVALDYLLQEDFPRWLHQDLNHNLQGQLPQLLPLPLLLIELNHQCLNQCLVDLQLLNHQCLNQCLGLQIPNHPLHHNLQ